MLIDILYNHFHHAQDRESISLLSYLYVDIEQTEMQPLKAKAADSFTNCPRILAGIRPKQWTLVEESTLMNFLQLHFWGQNRTSAS